MKPTTRKPRSKNSAATAMFSQDLFPVALTVEEAPPQASATAAPSASRTAFEFHHGDCIAGMKTLAADSVDVVVTSPPYNLDIAYSSFRDDARTRAEFLQCVGMK